MSSFWNAPIDSKGEEFVLDLGSLIVAYAIIDIVLDVGILALPLPVIGRLHMNRTKRWAVAGVFLLGALYVDLISFSGCTLADSMIAASYARLSGCTMSAGCSILFALICKNESVSLHK